MKDEKRYFIRIPLPGGDWKYIEVDKDRCDPAIQLYIREKNSNAPSGRYTPFFRGSTSGESSKPDTSKLLEIIKTAKEQWAYSLSSLGNFPKVEAEITRLDFASLVNFLAEHDLEKADKILRNILYELMSITVRQAAKIKTSDEDVARLSSTIEATETIQDDFYIRWGEAAETINWTTKEISAIEKTSATCLIPSIPRWATVGSFMRTRKLIWDF